MRRERKLEMPGKTISKTRTEVLNISASGLWLLADGQEYFLDFKEYPWFKGATVDQISDVELIHGHHLHWPGLDVDLELESLSHPKNYPLIYR